MTAKYLGLFEREYAAGVEVLKKARELADPAGKAALDKEIGVADTMRRSAHTMINMVRWVPLRDAYAAAKPGSQKDEIRGKLIAIGRDELANARAALAAAEADSRLGRASCGNYSPPRGGLFTAALISKKIGLLEDVLQRQLAKVPE